MQILTHQVECRPEAYVAVALWVVGTYGYHAAAMFCRLAACSATPRCGKSTLMGTVSALSCSPLKADNVSASAIFRVIEHGRPTLLIDEVDRFLRQTEGAIGILNAGYEASGAVLRSDPTPDGKSWQPRSFPVFCAVMLAGIGGIPDTILDRSIVIKMERAQPRSAGGQRQRPMRHRELQKARSKIAPHLVARVPEIEAAMAAGTTNIPPQLSDRAADNWEPLLAIADLAGGTWPQRARAAAVALSGGQSTQSRRELLLADISETVTAARLAAVQAWRAWARSGAKRVGGRPPPLRGIRSEDIVQALMEREDRPWPEFGRDGRGMTPTRLAAQLEPFGIKPKSLRLPATPHPLQTAKTVVVRGYDVAALRAIFRRYT